MPERVSMPKQPVEARRRNFDEVAQGLTAAQAAAEARRCLQCKNRPCTTGCPVEVDIPGFVRLVAAGDPIAAARLIKEKNALPAICGRVCPQETQCEAACVLGKKGKPLAIGYLERYAADCERAATREGPAVSARPDGPQVAVIGSGPAGLTCAADLARGGCRVTIFEILHAPGGVLRYGIPEFRLPKAIVDEEIRYVESLGVEIKLNAGIGQLYSLPELFSLGYEAVFIGTGAGLPHFLGIPGENLNGVYSANEFLTRTNLMKAYLFPEYGTPIKVGRRGAVVGAGNVAMDAARTALRLGAEEVTIVYRRSRAEMPARAEEIENAEEEGVRFRLLTNPVRVLGEDGWVTGLECLRMELGAPDASGRRRPVPVPGSEFVVPAETVVVAIGQGPNPVLTRGVQGLALNDRGYIIADAETGATSLPRVYAGGDIVTGSATVIAAMGAGKKAARAILRELKR
ncbi:MAG: NADPH-dependent glutamate synthase [Firmicutes bacterium]|nr:NADPH-dependent glutamate synthase [Bacillota bacterium]